MRMFENIGHINWAAFILATSSIFIIIVVKLITSRKLKHFLGNIPFPIELLIVSTFKYFEFWILFDLGHFYLD